jgi:uncharacterized protein (DUF58 family)
MSAHRIEVDDLIALRRDATRVDLGSRRGVLTDRAGILLSGFRGRGMEFEEHRAYQPGDDARTIDWRVTARTGRPHVRLYREERERPVLLAVDLRAPMWFGTRGCFKAVLAARAAALCAWAALANGDRVGGIAFGGGRSVEVRPGGGHRGVLNVFHALSRLPQRAGPEVPGELANALKRLLRTIRPGSLVAVFSDFRGLDAAERDLLQRLTRRAEAIIGFVHDPLDVSLPPPDSYPVTDVERRRPLLLDTGEARLRARWQAAFEQRRDAVRELARSATTRLLELSTARPPLDAFADAFERQRVRSAAPDHKLRGQA